MKRRLWVLALAATALAVPLWAQQLAPPDARVGSTTALSRPRKLPILDTYGTSNLSYYVIDAADLTPIATGVAYNGISNFQLRYSSSCIGLCFVAPVHLPAGASVQYIEIDYYDGSASGEVQANLGVCDITGESCAFQATDAGCATSICSGVGFAPGFSLSSGSFSTPFTVDNFLAKYELFAGNTSPDGSTAISQIIIGYRLQVSAAPALPTFTDVPTNSIYYQFIEALAAAGITGGCNQVPLQYCPDRPITRAEMAVFLAKALGLSFP